MDLDPDIVVPSIETEISMKSAARSATTPQSERFGNEGVLNTTTNTKSHAQRPESSPIRASVRTQRSRPSTPGGTSTSRSSSAASLRNERCSTPKLDKKRSASNLSIRIGTPAHQPQFRRASSNLNPATPLRTKAMERPQITPSLVAKDFFLKELQNHSKTGSEVVVFTHDACYGHRFSRPRSSKAALASIVERPERVHATLLGASTAYVRLGQRHKDGKHAPHPDYRPPSPPFNLVKSTRSIVLNHPAVTAVHGTKWMDTLQIMCDSAEAKLAMGQKELARPIGHSKDAKGNTLPPLHSGDLYLSSESLNALQGCMGGVCDAIDTVFQSDSTAKRAFVCIRPPGHHCSADMPSGFCWLNNVHVGISYATMSHGLTHAAIIDFDLHHGDGSQTIAWDHNRGAYNTANPNSLPAYKKVPIGYYSLHDINSYPCEYGDEEKVRNASTCIDNAHGQSIWNVHLEPWASHADFWHLYETKYKVLLSKAQSFLQSHSDALRQAGLEPKAAIFLSSGFDASEWESEGMQRHKVNVPTEFYARITADVVELAARPGMGVDERVISVLEGGYSDRALTSGVLSHLCGLTHSATQESQSAMQRGLSSLSINDNVPETTEYEPEWWHASNLELLETMVSGHLPKPATKPKDKAVSSYSSPTQASTAKMAEVARERKSLSAQMEARLLQENAPPEPVPEVDWITAAYELSRLLIPVDRQTLSCTHEELNAENTRARRDRLSLANIPTTTGTEDKMQLRDRKAKQPTMMAAQPRAASRTTNRRTTIAAASELPEHSVRERSRSRRRSSAASSMMSEFQNLKLDDRDERSSTRASSRAGSAIPAKPEVSLPVKKARAPVKKPAPKTTNGPKKAQGFTASQNGLGTVNEAHPPPVPINGTASTATSTDGIGEVTNGMKKISIKLKMPSEEQHNANRKKAEEAVAAASLPKTKTTRKPPVPNLSKAKAASAVPTDMSAPQANGASTVAASPPPNDSTTFSKPRVAPQPQPQPQPQQLSQMQDAHVAAPSSNTPEEQQNNATTMSAVNSLSATHAPYVQQAQANDFSAGKSILWQPTASS